MAISLMAFVMDVFGGLHLDDQVAARSVNILRIENTAVGLESS